MPAGGPPSGLAQAAQHAVQAAYDMRAADSTATIQEARERAVQAAEGLVVTVGVMRPVARPPGRCVLLSAPGGRGGTSAH